MALHRIGKGLDLPLAGEPKQEIESGVSVSRVAVLAGDFIGMKPRMEIMAGETVRRGDLLFEDSKRPGVRHTAPAAGTVVEVNRGDRRALQSVVIELSETEKSGSPSDADFKPTGACKKAKVVSQPRQGPANPLEIQPGEVCAVGMEDMFPSRNTPQVSTCV